MLLGRPISKAHGMSVGFFNDRIKFNDGEWGDAALGGHSEYPLPLTEDFDPAIIANGAAFDLVLEDENGPSFTLEHFQTSENVYMADECPAPEGSFLLKGKLLKSLDNSVLTLHDRKRNDLESYGKCTAGMAELLRLRHLLAWTPSDLDLKLDGTFHCAPINELSWT